MQFVVGKSFQSNVLSYVSRYRYTRQKVQLPRRIGVLGYGALGKAITEVILTHHQDAQIVALDRYDLGREEKRFTYLNREVTRENIHDTLNYMGLSQGDILIDVSTNIDFLEIWPLCARNGVMYTNTALEVWKDDETTISYPKSIEQMYEGSIGHTRDAAEKLDVYKNKNGPTSIFENGMNPGMVSQCVKRGLEDAARYFLSEENQQKANDIDKTKLNEWLELKNHSKIAQALGVHTIHCSETDNQVMSQHPNDMTHKLYNTWSARGLIQEGMIPIQVARGSHEDLHFDEYPVLRNNTLIMSWRPSVQSWARSWVPNQDIKGVMIPHGESYSIREYLSDPVTGYAPSQYYVYDYNPYAKEFIRNLPNDACLENMDPPLEVIHPMNRPSIRGHDKVGALLIMKNNRAWWTGTIMDDIDCKSLYGGKFGPTVLQVIAGVYGGFLWSCINRNIGCIFPEQIDTDFMINNSKHLLGRFVSTYVDLKQTHLKDCYKLQDFFCKAPNIAIKN